MLNEEMIKIARSYIGLKTYEGAVYNPKIKEFARYCNIPINDGDSWCSIFLNFVAKSAGYEYTGSSSAKSWLNVGERLTKFEEGCIVVYQRGNILSNQGHVGIGTFDDIRRNSIILISGNSGTPAQVTEHHSYPNNRVLGYIKLRQVNFGFIPPLVTKEQYSKLRYTPAVDPRFASEKLVEKVRLVDTFVTNEFDGISVDDFIKKYDIRNSTSKKDHITSDVLINYKNNKEAILSSLSPALRKEANKSGIKIIGYGAKIELPIKSFGDQNIYAVNKNLVLNNDSDAFVEREIMALVNHKKYKRLNLQSSNFSDGTLYKKFIHCSVYIYSKSFDPKGDRILNVTPFVTSLQTNVGKSGGNFSMKLPFIDTTEEEYAEIFTHYNYFAHRNMVNKVVDKDGYKKVTKHNIVDDDDSPTKYFKRTESFFKKHLQNQDLIFIKFDKLEIEKKDFNIKPFLSPQDLNHQQFDMIGLINVVSNSDEPKSFNINVSGMDLSKLLVDDGVAFYPIMYGTSEPGKYIKQTKINGTAERIVVTSKQNPALGLNYSIGIDNRVVSDRLDLFNYTGSIREWLMWIFSQITSIRVIPDNLLSSYSGDSGTFVASQSTNKDGKSDNVKFIPAKGIWKICKLVIDKDLDDRRLADTSIATSSGSLFSIVKKVVQDPFVELIMDTWGCYNEKKHTLTSQYIFMVRKTPFSKSSFKSLPCVNIYEDQVESEKLDWCTEIYTMFKLTPKGNGVISADTGSSLLALPVVMVNQYVAIWGVKTLDIVTNYLDFDPVLSADSSNILGDSIKQALQDYKWLLECYALLPFTREGSISIKRDRRIKRGMTIRYYPTGELFYVVGVTNTCSFEGTEVDGMTILQLQRGIVEKDYDRYFDLMSCRKVHRSIAKTVAKVPVKTRQIEIPQEVDLASIYSGFAAGTAFNFNSDLPGAQTSKTVTIFEPTTPEAQYEKFEDYEWELNEDNFNYFLTRKQLK